MKSAQESEEDKLIEPIVKWSAEARGRKAEFIAKLREVAGEEVRADRVYEWLSNDKKARSSPPYGWGVLLRKTAKALKISVE